MSIKAEVKTKEVAMDIKKLGYLFIIAGALSKISGCSIYPYHEQFSCENMNDYGRCLDVNGAYEVAVSGKEKGQPIGEQSKKKAQEEKANTADESINDVTLNAAQAYQHERYQKLKALIDNPKPPMVKQPEVVRTLILNYSDNQRAGSPLYGHRFVYFFGSDPEWVLSPYQVYEQTKSLPTFVK